MGMLELLPLLHHHHNNKQPLHQVYSLEHNRLNKNNLYTDRDPSYIKQRENLPDEGHSHQTYQLMMSHLEISDLVVIPQINFNHHLLETVVVAKAAVENTRVGTLQEEISIILLVLHQVVMMIDNQAVTMIDSQIADNRMEDIVTHILVVIPEEEIVVMMMLLVVQEVDTATITDRMNVNHHAVVEMRAQEEDIAVLVTLGMLQNVRIKIMISKGEKFDRRNDFELQKVLHILPHPLLLLQVEGEEGELTSTSRRG